MAAFDDIAHLLRRVGFGGTIAEIDALTPLSWEDAVDHVLDTSGAPSVASPPTAAPGATLSGEEWAANYRTITNWWIDQARTTPVPVVEKMTLFWSSHLPSSLDVVPFRLLVDQNQLYRRDALGSFEDLIQRASVHPAMLIYLDNRANVRGQPNENFARELMELFCLGVGHYTEADVVESARAWTGHTMNKTTFAYEFRADWHDNDLKTFMGQTRNWDGPQIVDHLLNGPTQRVAARWIARKLWRWMVADDPSDALVDALASAFIAGGLQTKALLRAILLRPEFRSASARAGLVRSPFEFVVAAYRHTGFTPADVAPQWLLTGMGQELFRPPNVDGWGTNRYWISTSAAWAKHTFADQIAWQGHLGTFLEGSEARSPDEAVSTALETFGLRTVSTRTRDALRVMVETVRSTKPWAERWSLASGAMLTPEFQLA